MILTNPNIFVDAFGPLLNKLLKSNCTLYYAVGSGDTQWDNEADKGLSKKSRSRTTLFNEVFRKKIDNVSDTDYIDDNNQVSITPTKKLQFRVELDTDEAIGELREFAVFVDPEGSDIPGVDEGTMILHEIHPKAVKAGGETVNRYVNLVLMN